MHSGERGTGPHPPRTVEVGRQLPTGPPHGWTLGRLGSRQPGGTRRPPLPSGAFPSARPRGLSWAWASGTDQGPGAWSRCHPHTDVVVGVRGGDPLLAPGGGGQLSRSRGFSLMWPRRPCPILPATRRLSPRRLGRWSPAQLTRPRPPSPRMTRVDLRNYLERIYSVPVAAVRTRVQHGGCLGGAAPCCVYGITPRPPPPPLTHHALAALGTVPG